jgi:hypothetical protein
MANEDCSDSKAKSESDQGESESDKEEIEEVYTKLSKI